MSTVTTERRSHPRRRVDLPPGLEVSTHGADRVGRRYAAKLVDIGDGGIGVEMAVPLTVGSIVSLNGVLKNKELGIRVQGRARVLHCRGNQEGNFHIGLAYEDLAYSRSA